MAMSSSRSHASEKSEPETSDLRFFTLNISGPSPERAEQLTEFMLALNLDVVVLAETRSNSGTGRLLAQFADAGYDTHSPLLPSSRERGVAVLSRAASPVTIKSSPFVNLSHRLVVAASPPP